MRERLFVATGNPGKRREITDLLAGLDVEVVGFDDLGIRATVEETGATFADNAIIKATTYAALSGCLTLADDSGLVVDALDGEPGVFSARYGDVEDDIARYQLVLAKLREVPDGLRTARFVAVIVLADPSGVLAQFEGVVEGAITHEPAGEHGFGYDPIFRPRGEQRTTAEMPPSEKHLISHRGKALAQARSWLESYREPTT